MFDWKVWRSSESLCCNDQSRTNMSWIITVGPCFGRCPTRRHGCWTLWTLKVCLIQTGECWSVIYTVGMTLYCWILMLMFAVPLRVALDMKPIRSRVCCLRTFVEFCEMWLPPWMAPLQTDTGIVHIALSATFFVSPLQQHNPKIYFLFPHCSHIVTILIHLTCQHQIKINYLTKTVQIEKK